jgi:two-component system chemotaxis response regulator CheY
VHTAACILVVEDDAMLRALLGETLQQEGYDTAMAPDGAEALRWLAARAAIGDAPPDLILLDMRMPVMDGWAFATAYRQTPGPHAPIVVMTAAPDAAARAAEIGAAAVLAKPFGLDELFGVVERFATVTDEQRSQARSGW